MIDMSEQKPFEQAVRFLMAKLFEQIPNFMKETASVELLNIYVGAITLSLMYGFFSGLVSWTNSSSAPWRLKTQSDTNSIESLLIVPLMNTWIGAMLMCYYLIFYTLTSGLFVAMFPTSFILYYIYYNSKKTVEQRESTHVTIQKKNHSSSNNRSSSTSRIRSKR